MTTITKLITTNDVLSIAFSNNTFYASFIKDSLIEVAQQDWLKNAIGKDYYDELLSQKVTGFSTANQDIMDQYLSQALGWYVAYLTLPFAAGNENTLGVLDNYFNTDNVRLRNIKALSRQAYTAIADSYLNAAIDYMKNNADSYPTFMNSATDDCSPVFRAGLVIDRKNKII